MWGIGANFLKREKKKFSKERETSTAYNKKIHIFICNAILSYAYIEIEMYGCSPRVELRGLKIGGGCLIHRKVVFCIFRCQSI